MGTPEVMAGQGVGQPSARWPIQPAPAKHMQMQMPHRLPAVSARIDHESVSRVGDSLAPRDGLRQLDQLTKKCRPRHVLERTDVGLREHEAVHRRLRSDVTNRKAPCTLGDTGCRHCACDDPTEKTGG